jgi:hypothetical protein
MFLSEWREFRSGALPCRKKKLDDSSRLDVVEIARIPDMLLELVSFLVGSGLIYRGADKSLSPIRKETI